MRNSLAAIFVSLQTALSLFEFPENFFDARTSSERASAHRGRSLVSPCIDYGTQTWAAPIYSEAHNNTVLVIILLPQL